MATLAQGIIPLKKDHDLTEQNHDLEVSPEWNGLIQEEADAASPIHQERIFLIMWQSRRSGGTYSELRKSVQGKNRFLRGLMMMGINFSEIQVIEQKKAWIPEKKKKDPAAGTRRAQNQQHKQRENTSTWQSMNLH